MQSVLSSAAGTATANSLAALLLRALRRQKHRKRAAASPRTPCQSFQRSGAAAQRLSSTRTAAAAASATANPEASQCLQRCRAATQRLAGSAAAEEPLLEHVVGLVAHRRRPRCLFAARVR